MHCPVLVLVCLYVCASGCARVVPIFADFMAFLGTTLTEVIATLVVQYKSNIYKVYGMSYGDYTISYAAADRSQGREREWFFILSL
jgi:hypothetical protein